MNRQELTEEWRQALEKWWCGCSWVRMTWEQAQPGDVILAEYTQPELEDGPPLDQLDTTAIFVMLEKPTEKFPRSCHTMQIALMGPTGEIMGSVSYGTFTLPDGAKLWLLGSCKGARI
jgi:hypothetical protein